MTDAIIERCAGDIDRARCDGMKPAYWHMTQEMAHTLKLERVSFTPAKYEPFLGIPVHPVSGLPKGKPDPMLVATGTPDTAQSLLEEAATLMKQCTDTEEFDGVSTITVYANMIAWLRRYNKQKEQG